MPVHKFTRKELPPGKIMLVRKLKGGTELAAIVDISEEFRTTEAFRMLAQVQDD